jgi:hypothetical protein
MPDWFGGSLGKLQISWALQQLHNVTRYSFEAQKGAQEEVQW